VTPITVTFDVSARIGLGEPSLIEASLFLPPDAHNLTTVVVAVPGGTYTRSYWHLTVPGRQGYSFAEHLTTAGVAVIAIDNLGTGASTRPTRADDIGFEVAAAANAEVAAQVDARLRSGHLAPGLPPMAGLRLIGVGHSLGGQLTAVQQGIHRSYERIAVLGSSFLGNDRVGTEKLADPRSGATDYLKALAGPSWETGYLEVPRAGIRRFHLPDVPNDVLAADDALVTVLPRGLAVGALLPFQFQPVVASIDVPVLLTYGEKDVSPEPLAEVACYPSSPEVTIVRLAGAAHCHNHATTRHRLWDRLVHWMSCPA
jgi:pimeloyl-ACP methyl ester carboxylesterase